MPYARNADLPESVRRLPDHGQDIFRATFNSAIKANDDEARAFAIAWSAVKNKYRKTGRGWSAIKKELQPAWIGFFLDAPTAEAIAIEGGIPASELHVTLYYGMGGEEDLAALYDVVETVAAKMPPFEWKTSGLGRFIDPNQEGDDYIVALVDSPELAKLREELACAFRDAGIYFEQDHGFCPHISLMRVPSDVEPSFIFNPVTSAATELAVDTGDGEYEAIQLGSDLDKAKADEITNFPRKGKNEAITLTNSQFARYPRTTAESIRRNDPEIWQKGGNIFGNKAYQFWGRFLDGDRTPAVLNWVKKREAWAARHRYNKNINGVVAAIKWGVVLDIGQEAMNQVVAEARKNIKERNRKNIQVSLVKELTNADKRWVTGYVSVAKNEDGSVVADYDGDVIDVENLRERMIDYMLKSRESGLHHQIKKGIGKCVEIVTFTPEMRKFLGVDGLVKEGTLATFYVEDDDVWQQIKDGKIKSFSIGGRAVRRPLGGQDG